MYLKSRNAVIYLYHFAGEIVAIVWKYRSQSVTLRCSAVQCGAVVKSFGQISPFGESDFVLLHCVRVSSTKSGIYSSRWNFRRRRILRIIPRARATTKLSPFAVSLLPQLFLRIAWTRVWVCKIRKFRRYLQYVRSKIIGTLCSLSPLSLKKPHAIFYCAALALRFHEHRMASKEINQSYTE